MKKNICEKSRFRSGLKILLRIAAIVACAAAVGAAWNFTLGAGLPLVLDRSRSVVHSPSLRESRSISLEELYSLIGQGELFVLDGRPEAEYLAAHIPSALSVPIGDAEQAIDTILSRIPTEAPVVVYCESDDCYDALRLFDLLGELGYSNVRLFDGGLMAWEAAGFPLEGEAR